MIDTTALKNISLDEALAQQAQQVHFYSLEKDLLLKRIKDGGHSSDFLADAFISCYRIDKPFEHSLGEVIKLDHEAIRVFHQILHIRRVPGWSDEALYEIEQAIKTILVGGVR